MTRQPLFSVTKKDFEVQTFRAGGKGGQNQNKRDTGVRIIHRASGARGEARDERSQAQNRILAFRRLVASPEFQRWLKLETARCLGQEAAIEQTVADWLREENLRVEYGNGRAEGLPSGAGEATQE